MAEQLRTWFKSTVRKDHQKVRSDGLRILSPARQTSKLSALTYERKNLSIMNGMTKAAKSTNYIQKGAWKGMFLCYLVLEERRTCPSSCSLIDYKTGGCYGNNSPLMRRANFEAPDFYDALDHDLSFLSKKYPGGFVVRLHELGDFFSMKYLLWWESRLEKYETLRVFGYSHCGGEIGERLDKMHLASGGRLGRWNIMNSEESYEGNIRPRAYINRPELAVTCPAQTMKSPSCVLCCLCITGGNISINFQAHGGLPRQLAKKEKLLEISI